MDYCDFVIWTVEGLHHDRMEPDHALWDEIQPATSAAAQGTPTPTNEDQREFGTVESCPGSAPKQKTASHAQ